MIRMLRHTLSNVGKMFDIAPRGNGPAAKRLETTAHTLRKRSDVAMLRADVTMVGRDMSKALELLSDGEQA